MRIVRRLRRLVAEVVVSSPRHAALAVALMIAASATEGISVLLLIPLLQLVGVDGPASDSIVGFFGSAFEALGVPPTLGSVLALYVTVVGLRTTLMHYQTVVNVTLREEFTAKMRARMYRAIGGAEWRFLVTRRPSEFVHVLAGEIGRVGAIAFNTVDLAVAVTLAGVYLALAVKLSPLVAVLVLLSAGLMAWASRSRLGEARSVGVRASDARRRLHTMLSEHVASMKTAKSYGAIDRNADLFTRLSRDLRDLTLELSSNAASLQRNLEFAWTVLLAIIVFGAFEILGASAGQVLVVLFICARLMPRMVAIYRQLQGLASALPVLDVVSDMERDCLDAAEHSTPGRRLDLHRSIRFEGVSFAYRSRVGNQAVRELNLEIPAGLTTAVAGISGAGKSTFADLLTGLLTPTEGCIRIDDHILTAENVSGWRESIGYVPQDTFLFHDTIRANLIWSRPEAGDDALWEALRLAAADEFVAAMPQGLGTVVGERGTMLSGGERQRLSLARALLRKPRILVLDEATSSLDSKTERRIQSAIEGLHQRMTIVIVTHRLSMIRGADHIHILDSGRLVESGSWEELLAAQGTFSELCRAQGILERPAVERQHLGAPMLPSM